MGNIHIYKWRAWPVTVPIAVNAHSTVESAERIQCTQINDIYQCL